jgi:hypothetical protein
MWSVWWSLPVDLVPLGSNWHDLGVHEIAFFSETMPLLRCVAFGHGSVQNRPTDMIHQPYHEKTKLFLQVKTYSLLLLAAACL